MFIIIKRYMKINIYIFFCIAPKLLASLNHANVTQMMGVVVGGPVGVTLVLEYYPDAHLPEYLRARSLAPAQVEGGRSHDSQTIR